VGGDKTRRDQRLVKQSRGSSSDPSPSVPMCT
jgi:hypothetical protein